MANHDVISLAPQADYDKTVRSELLDRPAPRDERNAILIHIYPSGPNMGTRYPLKDRPVIIGRGEVADVRIEDTSVSRRHAEIRLTNTGFTVKDLESTNGTYVNDQVNDFYHLRDGDYLRVGNCIYRFLSGGNVEAAYHEEIYRMTIIDALTETHNKRYLLEFLDRELARAVRYSRPLSLVMLDLDRFKNINDERGHLCGDHTLRELGHLVRKVIRKDDLFARYGGEEFAIVLPESNLAVAVDFAERIRVMVETHHFVFEDEPYKVTASFGVADYNSDEMDVDTLIRIADDRLFQAKRDGRNRVNPKLTEVASS